MGKKEKKFAAHFCETTNLHGFSDAHSAKKVFLRCFWVVIILAALGGFTYEIYQVVDDYMKSPMMTVFDILSAESLPFPTIQVCPYNYVSKRKVKEAKIHPAQIGYAKLFFPSMSRDGFNNMLYTQTNGNFSSNYATFVYSMLSADTVEDGQDLIFEGLIPADYATTMNMDLFVQQAYSYFFVQAYIKFRQLQYTDPLQIYGGLPFNVTANLTTYIPSDADLQQLKSEIYPAAKPAGLPTVSTLPPDIFSIIGHDTKDILKSCIFQGKELICAEVFEEVFDQKLGRCFLSNVTRLQMTEGWGMTVVVDLMLEDAWVDSPEINEGLEIRITTDYEPVTFKGISIPPGNLAKINLRGTKYVLEEGTGGACYEDRPREVISTSLNHSDSVCRADCIYKESMQSCGCTPILQKKFLIDQSIPYCTSPAGATCLGKLFDNGIFSKTYACTKKCRPKCEYWEYDPVITYSKFPSYGLKEQLYDWGEENNEEDFIDLTVPRLEKNYIILDIAFERMQYKQISQKVSMTANGFLSQIGGQMGLFMGASLISMVQLGVIFIAGCCSGLFRTKPPTNPYPKATSSKSQKRPNAPYMFY